MEEGNKTCARLEVHEGLHDSTVKKTLFVKSTWEPTKAFPTSFSLAVTDGCQAWTFEGSESYVKERAEVWDKEVSWVTEKLKFYLTMGQPGVAYHFTKTRDDHRKLSFEIQDKDTNLSLRANLQMVNALSETVICDLLGFLLQGNEKLSLEYRRKCRDFDGLKESNKAYMETSEQCRNEEIQYKKRSLEKFVGILNSKKSKCRELRDENARLKELLRAKENVEKDDSTSSSSDDDDDEDIDDQPLEKEMERGEGSRRSLVSEDAAINEDPAATKPLVAQLEIEPPKEDLPSNAPAALTADAPYTGIQRKRRRPVLQL
ncbi:hypothetical protein M758_6G027700 [Ceratodon purpureus]|nr:hypothetical protein M758_6G027700 [Ceratodon purpureus]